MGAVWIVDIDILDERHFFKDITVTVSLTWSAVDDGKGECVSVLENQHRWHGIEFVDFTSDVRKRGAGVDISLEFDSEKQIRVIDGVINTLTLIEGDCLLGVLFDFVSGELEKEVSGVPFVEQCFLTIHPPMSVKVFKECFNSVGRSTEYALTFVAQHLEEVGCVFCKFSVSEVIEDALEVGSDMCLVHGEIGMTDNILVSYAVSNTAHGVCLPLFNVAVRRIIRSSVQLSRYHVHASKVSLIAFMRCCKTIRN